MLPSIWYFHSSHPERSQSKDRKNFSYLRYLYSWSVQGEGVILDLTWISPLWSINTHSLQTPQSAFPSLPYFLQQNMWYTPFPAVLWACSSLLLSVLSDRWFLIGPFDIHVICLCTTWIIVYGLYNIEENTCNFYNRYTLSVHFWSALSLSEGKEDISSWSRAYLWVRQHGKRRNNRMYLKRESKRRS